MSGVSKRATIQFLWEEEIVQGDIIQYHCNTKCTTQFTISWVRIFLDKFGKSS